MEIAKLSSSLKPMSVIPGEKTKLLWKDGGFQECLKHTYEYSLSDSAPYYFERME